MVNLRINWTLYTGEVRNLAYQEWVECLFIFLVYHSFPIFYIRMPQLVGEKCAVPDKSVIQGMDLVYSQTKSGLPDIVNLHISKLIP